MTEKKKTFDFEKAQRGESGSCIYTIHRLPVSKLGLTKKNAL